MYVILQMLINWDPYIDQTFLTRDFYNQNPYKYTQGAQYERLNMEIKYLEESYYSVHKRFIYTIDHLDYYPSSNNTTFFDMTFIGTKTN